MLFSAAYQAKLDACRQQPRPKTTRKATWQRVRYETEENRWGYYIETPVVEYEEEEVMQPTAVTTNRTIKVVHEDGRKNDELDSHERRNEWDQPSKSNDKLLLPMSPSTANGSAKTSRTPKIHSWVSLWFLISAPIIAWDASYCFMRPRSMVGGDLHWIWKPYAIYQDVDYIYGLESYNSKNGFTNAQSSMNVLETLLNLFYLYLAHIAQSPTAPLVGFTSASLTLAKTILYWAQEYFCGYCAVGHNPLRSLIILWIIPNGIWLVLPTLIVITLGKDLVKLLRAGAQATAKEL